MTPSVELVLRGVMIGLAGAALMDVWSFVLRRRFGVPTLDYALLGRWIGHVPRGRLVHERIASAEPVAGERPLGWLAHYAIGVTFAFVLVAIWGPGWLAHPTIVPALVVGLGTIVAPWFVMQPAMGAGIAGSRSPDPTATRLRNLGTHSVYGLGLYMAAVVVATVLGQG
jgi:Protein of unknown function (DUF2938)